MSDVLAPEVAQDAHLSAGELAQYRENGWIVPKWEIPQALIAEMRQEYEDLLARIDLWTFELPSLKERSEDIEPNLEHELARLARERGRRVTMSREARSAFLRFAADPASSWRANFRDFGAAVTRMATLAEGGRITREVADEESERLRRAWSRLDGDGMEVPRGGGLVEEVLGAEAATDLDRFDRVQLEDVLGVCRRSRTMSDAGRTLFAASRGRRTSTNDADRLRKYLARFGLKFIDVAAAP